MRQALLIVDVQPCFAPPDWLLEGAGELPPEVLGRLSRLYGLIVL